MSDQQLIGVDEALSLVLESAAPREPQVQPIAAAQGHVLEQSVFSPDDLPLYDRAVVDGYAVRSDDIGLAGKELRVLELVTAGQTPTREVATGTASRVMTGSPIPIGADAMVMVERTTVSVSPRGEETVYVPGPVVHGQNITRRGDYLRGRSEVLTPGHVLRPVDIGILAELGVGHVRVATKPSVALLATGSELCPSSSTPGPAQIRNSNSPLLHALLRSHAESVMDLGIAIDTVEALRPAIARGLACDALVLSGGVSTGVHDLVPQVLEDLGVERVFHKVDLKPGKPLWFGVIPTDRKHTLVFGLPGNPVSSLVGCELFVRPALLKMSGWREPGPRYGIAKMADEYRVCRDRITFLPARGWEHEGELFVTAIAWKGSGDLCGMASANYLIRLPKGDFPVPRGQPIAVLKL